MTRLWPARLRARLTVGFAAVASVTAFAVAGSSYVVVRQARLQRATDAAVAQSRFNLTFSARTLVAGASDDDIEGLLRSLERRGGFDVVVVGYQRSYQTSVSLTTAAIPEDLKGPVSRNRVVAARRAIGGRRYVVVGGLARPTGHQVWFFYPLDDVLHDLAVLARVLAGSALLMVALSSVIGAVAARGLLRPVGQARDAAHRMEAGDLATRLPVEGDDEFAELSQSFNAMAEALGATVASLRALEASHRQFVADVSHELRTPVTALGAAADVLAPGLVSQGDTADPQGRAARILVDEARRLRHLVEELMEISRLDAGVAVVERDLIDLRRLVEGAVADRSWGDVVRINDVARAVVEGDRRRLDRVITNLVDNALRHGRPPVEVSVTPGDGQVVVEVRDHGPGIPPEHLGRVFDRFYKGDRSRSRSASSGLGLAIAKENVVLHGGRIEAANDEGGGARIRVTLPLAAVAQSLPVGDGPENHDPQDGLTATT